MSKKTRKKSSSTTAKRATTKAARAVKTQATKTGTTKTSAKASSKTFSATSRKTGKTIPAQASHKAPSKPLKANPPAGSKPPAAPKPPAPPKPAAAAKAAGTGLAEGARAPAFRLPRDGGQTVSLGDFAGQKLVLFFYPRADTPGCTREAIDFTRLKGAFTAAGTAVLGISADKVKTQESFRNKHQLGIPLISDEQHEMLEAYGAWGEKSMYGRAFLGIIRSTVLIDGSGRIAKIWRNVRVDGHADEVLAAARSL